MGTYIYIQYCRYF